MGAGGVDGIRRSFYVGHVKKGYESYRKGAQNPKPNHGDRHGSPGLKRYSKSLHGRQMNPFHDDVQDRQCLAPERFELEKDYEVQWPPQKKRKISPIVGNGECKFVGVTFQIKAKTVGFTASPLSSDDEMSNLIDDDVMAEKSLDVQADSENFGFPQFAELNVHPNPDSRQIEEEGSIQSPNIATSRWASDLLDSDKSTSSDGEGIYKTIRWTKNLSTPESGECLMNDYEGQRASSNCFNISDNELESVILTNFDNAQADHSDVREQEEKEEIVSVQEGLSMLLGSRSVDEYEKLKKISEGSYGVVYRARDRITGEVVALKKVKMNLGSKDEFGFPLTSLREIGILLSCNHPSIVNVKEVVVGNLDSVFMVLEHLEHDLKNLMDHLKYPFSTSEVKCLMMQLLEGLKYLHDNWIIHRDLKPANLLYSNKGELKICDFGMARLYGNLPRHYTQLVVTQWYRAPELLLGAKQYSTSIDMWSVGCIMAELLTSKPLFQGKCGSDIDQLHKIFGVLGTPDEKIWPGFSALPGAKAVFVKQPCNMLRKKFPAASNTGSLVLSDLGLDLLNKLLTHDPEKRITVDAALNHDWFLEVPLPKSKEFMPTFPPRRD